MICNEYSDWLKIDLHIHTDWSKKTKDNDYKGNFSVETLYRKIKDNNVEIFSLTDHNIINVNAYKEYYEKYKQNINNPLLLLGIEIDIKKGDKIFHSLLIFNVSDYPTVSQINRKIEEKFSNINMEERSLSFQDIVDLFSDYEFFFIPHAGGHKNIKDAHRSDFKEAQKMILLMDSALEKVKEEKIRIYNEGFDQMQTAEFKARNDIAYINFSDNHNLEKYPCKHMDRENHEFNYIKGGKSYETLRLAFIDPESRIKTKEQFNETKTHHILEKLQITSQENNPKEETKIIDVKLNFSPHLNVIIGGRSSGKSLLMNLFSKMIDTLSQKSSSYYDLITNNYDIKIKSGNDSDIKEKTSISPVPIYLKQGDIVNYFEKNNLYDLVKQIGKEQEYNEKKDKFVQHKRELEEKVNHLVGAYGESHKIESDKRYVLHQSSLDKILSKEFILRFEPEEIQSINDRKQKEIKETMEKLHSLNTNLDGLENRAILSFNEVEKGQISEFKKLIQRKTKFIESEKEKNDAQIRFIETIKQVIDDKTSSLSEQGQEKNNAQRKREELIDDIGYVFRVMRKLNRVSQSLCNFDYALQEKIPLSDESSLVLEVEKNEGLKELIIDGIKNLNSSKTLYHALLDLLNGKTKLKNYTDSDSDTLDKKINTQIERIKNNFDKPVEYLQYRDGTNSKGNSPGYNSEQYLKMLLDTSSSHLIFIDQPEDNLGNKFISGDLVRLFRDKKFKKQIFLVTHNPAIVVYGDAESIIVAENNNKEISYKQITLENKEAQKEICQILDGGEYIFNQRAKKYNIQRILREERNGK